LNNTGTIDVQSGILKLPNNFTNNGTLKGVGTFATSLLTNAGHVAPGGSPGTLALNGNFTQPSGGFLDIELSNAALFDVFNITGTAALGGTLA
jgi:fibronectin-binding autotransporter adhesin